MCNCNKPVGPVKRNPVKQAVNYAAPRNNVQRKSAVSGSGKATVSETIELPGETIEDRCRMLGYMLGLEEPVSERVLVAAVDNVAYMRRLLSSQNDQPRLFDLLNNPPLISTGNSFSTGVLISKAGKAMMRWAISGFPTVSKEMLKKREDACLSCPQLAEATHSLQRFSASPTISDKIGSRTGNRACTSCGCVVHNKIRLATESCPEHISGNANMNRWGETIR